MWKNGLLSGFSSNINPRMQLGDGVGVNVFVLLPTGTFEGDPSLRLNSESSTSVLLRLPHSCRSHDSGSIFGSQRALRIRGVRLDLCWRPQRSTSPAAAPYLGPCWAVAAGRLRFHLLTVEEDEETSKFVSRKESKLASTQENKRSLGARLQVQMEGGSIVFSLVSFILF